MKPDEHIATIKAQLDALETDGHIEKRPDAWHYHSQMVSAVYGLELALTREDKMKGETE